MPTYTYRCNECEYEFDKRQRFSDDPLTICPKCEGDIRRVVNSVGIVFKGSGFYVTDNRNGSSSTTSTTTDKAGSDAPKADATKPEKKKKSDKKSSEKSSATA